MPAKKNKFQEKISETFRGFPVSLFLFATLVVLMFFYTPQGHSKAKANDKIGLVEFHNLCKIGTSADIKNQIIKGANVLSTDARGLDALMYATIDNPDPFVVKLLLEAGADVRATEPNEGETALHIACADNNIAVIQELLDAGADINAVDYHGNTPLFLATYNLKNLDVIELLAKKGAVLDWKNNMGKTVLSFVLERWLIPTEKEKKHEEADLYNILEALLTKAKIDVNIKNENGDTALISGCKVMYTDKPLLMLLSFGANAKLTDSYGKTAVHYAEQNPNFQNSALHKELLKVQ